MRAYLLCGLLLAACGDGSSVQTTEDATKKPAANGASSQAPPELFPNEDEGTNPAEPSGPKPPLVLGQVFFTKPQMGGPSRLTRVDLGTRASKDMGITQPNGVGGLITCDSGLVTWSVAATGVSFVRDSDKVSATVVTPCTGNTVGVYPTSSGDFHASGFECDDGSKQIVVIDKTGAVKRTITNGFEPLLKPGPSLFFTRQPAAAKSLHVTPADQTGGQIVDVAPLPTNATYDISADLRFLAFNASSTASGTKFTRVELSTGTTVSNTVPTAAAWPFALSVDGQALLVSLTRASDSALVMGLAVFSANDSWLLRDSTHSALVLDRNGGIYWINKNATF